VGRAGAPDPGATSRPLPIPAREHGFPGSGSIPTMLLLVDLDGVVYRGTDPVPGVAAVLAARAAAGDDVVYVTNNASWYRADYVTRLSGMGAPADADRVVSSARATALYLHENMPEVRRVLVVGTSGLVHELTDMGLEVVEAAKAAEIWAVNGRDSIAAAGPVDAVVVGLDPEFTYAKMACASGAIRAGSRFVATNRDNAIPYENGLLPGTGSIVTAIEAASATTPISLGKPGPLLLEVAARAVGRDVKDAVMIGDSLGSDIEAAVAVGCRSVLILTGISKRHQAEALPPGMQPTLIVEDAAELAVALEQLAAERR
jgi:phosphoglycolate/pyridoxal phosphate phosphatase family enzyme